MTSAEVVVVGAGPAGLAAAAAAARAGARTVLLDEGDEPGGQLLYRLPVPSPEVDGRPPLPRLADLLVEARDAGVDVRPRSLAWGAPTGNRLPVTDDRVSDQLAFDVLVLATGSTDLALPFPGATLPGVFSARALRILLNRHRVLPGRRVAVLGAGPDAAEVARDLRLAGGEVVVAHPASVPDAVRADGTAGVESVTLDGRRHAVDLVAVAVGRQPDASLALMAGGAMAFAPSLGGWVPALDDRLRTDDPRLLVGGDAAGVCDPATALAEGRYAGVSAAATLGLLADGALADARATYEAAAPDRVALRRTPTATYAQPAEWEAE